MFWRDNWLAAVGSFQFYGLERVNVTCVGHNKLITGSVAYHLWDTYMWGDPDWSYLHDCGLGRELLVVGTAERELFFLPSTSGLLPLTALHKLSSHTGEDGGA